MKGKKIMAAKKKGATAKEKAVDAAELESKTKAEAAAVPGPKPIDIELVHERVKYDFNQDELVTLGERMAELLRQAERVKDEKKSSASSYDSTLKQIALDVDSIVQGIRDKYEFREVECFLIKNFSNRKKYLFRADQITREELLAQDMETMAMLIETGNLGVDPVRVDQIRSWELQKEIPFQGQNELDPADAETLVDEETGEDAGPGSVETV
jgi:hypothetical protein